MYCKPIAAQGTSSAILHKKINMTTGSLSGKVFDKKINTALPGATVYIPDLKIAAVTDQNGYYFFRSLPLGNFLIEVHFIGYSTVTRSVTINNAVVENFELENNIVEENAVVVTGQSKATQVKRSPIPIILVSNYYIEHRLV